MSSKIEKTTEAAVNTEKKECFGKIKNTTARGGLKMVCKGCDKTEKCQEAYIAANPPAGSKPAPFEGQVNPEGVYVQNRNRFRRSVVGVNKWGHTNGSIGANIDSLIQERKWTKKEIAEKAETKMTKVNSHIAHLKRDKGAFILINKNTKKVSFCSEKVYKKEMAAKKKEKKEAEKEKAAVSTTTTTRTRSNKKNQAAPAEKSA